MKYLDALDEHENVALLSVVTDESPEDYQARNDIPVLNTAVKRRRRAFQKAQLKLNEDDKFGSFNKKIQKHRGIAD